MFYINAQLPCGILKLTNPLDIGILAKGITKRINKILVAGIQKPMTLVEPILKPSTPEIYFKYSIKKWGK